MSNQMWKSEGSEDGNREEQKTWKRKKWRLEKGEVSKSGDWKRGENVEKERKVEIGKGRSK